MPVVEGWVWGKIPPGDVHAVLVFEPVQVVEKGIQEAAMLIGRQRIGGLWFPPQRD
jgi:hypothetical protein